MADVKFNDLTIDENPATTDSVLAGNDQGGMKRVTLQKIADLFTTNHLIHKEFVQGVTNPAATDGTNTKVHITAPDVAGYTFAFWLTPVSLEQVRPLKLDSPDVFNTDVEVYYAPGENITTVGPVKIAAEAIYFKSANI